MYFKDLHEQELHFGVVAVKVGWLDEGQPYTQGVAPKEFVSKLAKIPLGVHTKGWHDCPFCGKDKSSSQYRIKITPKKFYDVPEMIFHYMEVHNYLPPQEFIDAVMKVPVNDERTELRHLKRFK